ncbi:RICIN domain-containing protein [Catenulispora subtropica]|uniref:Ricin B lectin domain-containing protein n=1 Tax=Catenulispora subtropica TaxID=450798 RepID=A0ABP5CKU4_9ACTN
MKRWAKSALAAAVTAGCLSTLMSSANAVDPNNYPRLMHSGPDQNLCLDADGSLGRLYAGDKVQLWACNSTDTFQQWTFKDDGTIHSVADDSFCLDASMPYGKLTLGAAVQVYPCNGGANQVWLGANQPTWGSSDPHIYSQAQSVTGQLMYLDANGSTPLHQGTSIDVWTYNGGANQEWYGN